MTAAMFLADTAALAADRVVLDGPEGRHAADVRRLRPGEAVDVTDGRGLLAHGVVAEAGRGRLVVEVRRRLSVPVPAPRLVVVQALPKGGRDEDAVEAMTEVGVDEVAGWAAERAIARWTDRTAARWRATARESAKQSRRAWLPDVTGPLTTAEVADRIRAATLAVVLHEQAPERLAALPLPSEGEIVLVVGPEGGVSADELAQLADAGARVCRLGDTVLRTSTAGVAALSLVCAATRWR